MGSFRKSGAPGPPLFSSRTRPRRPQSQSVSTVERAALLEAFSIRSGLTIGVENAWSAPPFPKHRRHRLIDFPLEKFIIARPRVDLHPANLAAETTGVLVWMLLPSRGVRQPAIGTAKIFGGPYVACHPAIMPRTEPLSSLEFCQDKRPGTQTLKAQQKLDSAFLIRRILKFWKRL
jgi:hypothetical protein